MEREDKGMKKERGNRTWSRQRGGRILIVAVMAAMVLCMGCSTEEATSDNPEPATEDVVETPTPLTEEVIAQPEATQPDDSETEVPSEPEETGSEELAEPEVTEDADEWTALYNDYKDQGVYDFTVALCEAGYDQICLVNGDSSTTNYFSVEDGDHYTIPGELTIGQPIIALLYVPYIPTEYSCDNENIHMYYYFDVTNEKDFLKNCIQLSGPYFEGDDVPVNFSVTFEDGSTQEITVYLTYHAE